MTKNSAASTKADHVNLMAYGFSDTAVHNELDDLVNGSVTNSGYSTDIGGNRCTVIITVPKTSGGSLTKQPGHCGVVLWNASGKKRNQSFGIFDDGTFGTENVNVTRTTLKDNAGFLIWYFTKKIDGATYESMRKRMSSLHDEAEVSPKGYGKVFVNRFTGSYSCVTAVDTILCAGGLSWGVASMTTTPHAYAQTFSTLSWNASYADNMKHV